MRLRASHQRRGEYDGNWMPLLAAVIEARCPGWVPSGFEVVGCLSASHTCCSVTTGHVIVMRQPMAMTSPRAGM
jgi:hypothetical protein